MLDLSMVRPCIALAQPGQHKTVGCDWDLELENPVFGLEAPIFELEIPIIAGFVLENRNLSSGTALATCRPVDN